MKVKTTRTKGFIIQGTGGWSIHPGEVRVISTVQQKNPKFEHLIDIGALVVVSEKTPVAKPAITKGKKDVVIGNAKESKEFQTDAKGAVVAGVNDIPTGPRKKTVDELANGPSPDDDEDEGTPAPKNTEGALPKKAKGPRTPTSRKVRIAQK